MNQEGKEVHVYLGSTGTELCPVAALLTSRGGGLVRLFRMSSGRGLTREQFVSRMRTALDAIVVDNRLYDSHG